MKFFDPTVSIKELNELRFSILEQLASGRITAQDAKKMCRATQMIDEKAVYVACGDATYTRIDATRL